MSVLPNCNLPECVIEEILTRLPIKSLLRFMSVSKSWYSLLTNPSFIHMHLQFHPTNTNKLLISSINRDANLMYVLNPDDQQFYVYNGNDNTYMDLPTPFPSSKSLRFIMGSSNGLVCIEGYFDGRTLVLWNPATRQFKYLDPPPGTSNWDPSNLFSGFGFVPDTKDYKFVVICRTKVYVYTLSSDSWRVKDILAPVSDIYSGKILDVVISGKILDGVIYLMGDCIRSNRMNIVSFDLRDEVYGRMKGPLLDSIHGRLDFGCRLMVLKGSLSLIRYPQLFIKGNFEVWVMTELGVEESWTKLIIPQFPLGAWPVESWKEGQIIFRSRTNSKMWSYDPCSQQTQYFSVLDVKVRGVFSYVQSLEVVDRCRSGRVFSRMHVQNENLVSNFAIPGPKLGSSRVHCKLCGKFFSGKDELKLHLTHQGDICPPCPFVYDYVKKKVEMYLRIGKIRKRKQVWVLKKKLIIKWGQRGNLV